MADIKATISSSNSSLTAAVNPSAKIIPTSITNASITAETLNLNNVTNESKATMFTDPAFTGIPTAPTAAAGTNTTQLATTGFVTTALSSAELGAINSLTDVTLTSIGNGELIVYNGTNFVNQTLAEAGIATTSDLSTKQNSLTFGISNTNAVRINSTTVTANDIAIFTSTGLAGRTFAELKTDLSLNNVENKSSATILSEIQDGNIPSTITRDTELEAHTSRTDNPHSVTASQIGLGSVEDKSSATIRSEIVDSDIPSTIARDSEVTSAIATHTALSNPHGITKSTLGLTNVEDKSSATIRSEIVDSDIPSGIARDSEVTASLLVHTSDTTNPHSVTPAQIGLGNVTNQSKAVMFTDPTFTGNVQGITKTHVGLANIDNTSDINKPVSNATQTALNLKANISEPTFTGDASFDNNTLFIDSSNNRVCIGAANPDERLTVAGNAKVRGTLIADNIQVLTSGAGIELDNSPTNNNHIANKAYVDLQISNLIDNAPGTLNTLNEIAAALNDSPAQIDNILSSIGTNTSNIATNTTNIGTNTTNIALKANKNDPTFTGGIKLAGASATSTGIELVNTDGGSNMYMYFAGSGNSSQFQIRRNAGGVAGKGAVAFRSGGDLILNQNGGNVGIGMVPSGHKLDVTGNTQLAGTLDVTGNVTFDTNTFKLDSSANYIGIGTASPDRKLVIDGNVNIIKGDNHIANKAVLRTRSEDGTGTFVDFGGPVVVTHDLFKNSSVPGGFADNSNHFHTIQKIDRITQQGTGEVKNVERVEEQYYAIQSNNLRNDKAAFWNWHRITRAVDSTDVSLSNLVGWNVQADQDFNGTEANPDGRRPNEQVPFSQSQTTTFTFTTGNNPLSNGELIRVTVTTDFIGPFVAQTHFAKVTSATSDAATVVLYAGNYKSKAEVPLSPAGGGAGSNPTHNALNDTSTFSVDSINTSSFLTLASGTGLTVTTDSTRRSDTGNDFSKLVQFTTASAHNLQVNDTLTIVTDGTGGFQPAEVAHVLTRDSATQVTCVYGRLFEPHDNVQLSSIGNSAVVGILKGTLDGIHRYTAGDQLMTFWSNNVGRYKSYQIGPGSQADGDCIAIGKNTYNKDANTIKIGYENAMLNIDSAGIDVAGTLDTTGNATIGGTLGTTGNATIGGTLGTTDDITITKSSGTASLTVSGHVAQLNLNDNDNSSDSTITNITGELYYNANGGGTDYGNHVFTTSNSSNTKPAIMFMDGDNANVGIGTTTPDSAIKLDVNGTFRASNTAYLNSDVYIDTNTLFVDSSTNKVQIGGSTSTAKQKGKLTVVGSNASGTGLAITHHASTVDFVEMYYKGTAGGGPFIMSRSQTGGAEIVLFNNGDINLNGGYKGVTSSANTSKTPDNVGIGVNAATKLNHDTADSAGTANTNGKPTNKLHIFEKSGLTMGGLAAPVLNNALVRIEESTANNINLYMDGNSIYGTNSLALGCNTNKDITFFPGKTLSLTLASDGTSTFAGTVSGVTPTADAHLTTKAYVDTQVAGIVDGAPEALNTLNELAEALNDSPSQIDNILTSVGQRLVIGNNLSDLNNAATARTNLGLGNVEDTAISTFAGTSNITTVGTIGTGTWQGTAIANAYVADLPTSKVTSGTFADARISSSSVTQHSGDITSVGTLTSVAISGEISSTSTVSRPVQSDETDTNPIRNIRRMTQSAYDGLNSPDGNTLYIIE